MSRQIAPRAKRRRLRPVVALAAGILSGCGLSPEIQGNFPGLDSLDASSGAPARLFIIHGITPHKPEYADGLVDRLATRMGLSELPPENSAVSVPGAVVVAGAPASIVLREYKLFDPTGERLRVTALTWSPLTDPIKDKQFATDEKVDRVLVNGLIKTDLIDKGLSDAVLYLGAYRKIMRRGVTMGLCAFLDGKMTSPDACDASAQNDAPVAFISESLGSSMLFDGVSALNKSSRDSLAGRTRLLFMFANQLPLLELADVGSTPEKRPQFDLATEATGKLAGFLQAHAAGERRRGAAPQVDVVAFTDPNDLLSYPLDPANTPHDKVQNVIVPVATRWLGLFADPVKAHTGYENDDAVLSLVVCGSSGCAR